MELALDGLIAFWEPWESYIERSVEALRSLFLWTAPSFIKTLNDSQGVDDTS